jgi:hypothetical protein
VRDLEEMLSKEREARLYAEDMMQKMEESNHARMSFSTGAPLVNGHSELDKAFDPPAEQAPTSEPEVPPSISETQTTSTQPDKAEQLAAAFQARIDSMALEMSSLREQLEAFRLRAERAEAERDADRKTLAEMVIQIRQRDDEEKRRDYQRRRRSPSEGRRRRPSQDNALWKPATTMNGSANNKVQTPLSEESVADGKESETAPAAPSISEASTTKPGGGSLAVQRQEQDATLLHTLPYASMIGVVLLGMGFMAYLNGWQPQPRLDR